MNLLNLLLIAGVFALFALGVLAIVWGVRRREAAQESAARALGFRRIDPPDAWLVERLIRLQVGREGHDLAVGRVYERRGGDHTLYLFNMTDRDGDDSPTPPEGAVAVRAPALRLPAFTLHYRVPGEGRLVDWTNRVLARLAARGRTRVAFPEHAPFDGRYLVVGESEAAVRAFFTPDRLRALAGTELWAVQADGDLFTFDAIRFQPSGRQGRLTTAERVEGALRALAIFLPRA